MEWDEPRDSVCPDWVDPVAENSDLPVFSDCCDRRVLADAMDFFPVEDLRDLADFRECVDACDSDLPERLECMDDFS